MTALKPFTIEHFDKWASSLVLDTGEQWRIEDFQAAFVDDLFGFTRAKVPAECWLVIPEGCGKTTLVAGLALYYLEHVEMAAIPVAAASREQAETLYKQAEAFVIRSEWMHELKPNVFGQAKGKKQLEVPRFECQEGFRRVRYHTGGIIQIRAADDRTGDGIIPNGLLVLDEPHRQRSPALYELWNGKAEKRRAQFVAISTSGEPGEWFEEMREQMRRGDEVERKGCFVRSRSEASVLHEWAVPEDGDVEDLELVAAANPLSTVTVETLRRKRNKKSWNLPHWRRFTCNLPTRGEMAAITEAEWFAAQIEDEIPVGQEVEVGLDVGWKYDTTAIVPLWIRDAEYRLFDQVKVLTPPRDGNMLDPREVEHALTAIHLRNPIRTLVMDMSNAESLASWAEQELHVEVIDRGQSNAFLVPDYEKFMEALREGWIKHAGDRDLTRHALNAIARPATFGDLRFDRPVLSRRDALKQDQRVIDALQAAAMVHHFAAGELGSDIPLAAFV